MVVRPPAMLEVVMAVAKRVCEPVVEPPSATSGRVVNGKRPS